MNNITFSTPALGSSRAPDWISTAMKPQGGLFAFMSEIYKQKLTDRRWQKKRLRVLEYAKWRCQMCGSDKDSEQLHCHHSYYAKGKMPWEQPDGSIIAVCGKCHDVLHPEKAKPKEKTQPAAPLSRDEIMAKFDKLIDGIKQLGGPRADAQ